MKQLLSWIGKKAASGIITGIFLTVTVLGVVYALNFPSEAPDATQTPGGKFAANFTKIFNQLSFSPQKVVVNPDICTQWGLCLSTAAQTTAASWGAGTIIEPRCASWNEGICTIPSCPSGWTDLWISNYAYTTFNGSNFGGYRSRYCTTTTAYAVIEPRCASWNESICTIPSCPSGWTDLWISNYAYTTFNGSNFGGYRSRYCVK